MPAQFLNLFEFKIKIPQPVLQEVLSFVLGEYAHRVLLKLGQAETEVKEYPTVVGHSIDSLTKVRQDVMRRMAAMTRNPKAAVDVGFANLPLTRYETKGVDEISVDWGSENFEAMSWRLIKRDDMFYSDEPYFSLAFEVHGDDHVLDVEGDAKQVAARLAELLANYRAHAEHMIDKEMVDRRVGYSAIRQRMEAMRDQGRPRRDYYNDGRLPVNQVIVTSKRDFADWPYAHLMTKKLTRLSTISWPIMCPQFAVYLVDKTSIPNAAGHWQASDQLPWIGHMEVVIGNFLEPRTVTELDYNIKSLTETCEHELRHGIQFWLQNENDLGDIFGMPPKALRTPAHTSQGYAKGDETLNAATKLDHPLRDIEFYTNLGEITGNMTKTLGRIAPPLRREAFKKIVGLMGSTQPGHKDYNSLYWAATRDPRLAQVRAKMPDKWQHYVRILYQEMQRLGLL